MKILTYNIFKGGESRLPRIQSVITSVQPDILCLQETNGFESLDTRLEFGKNLNYPYHAFSACGTPEKNYSVTTYARLPIPHFKTFAGFRHAGLMTVFSSRGVDIALGNVLLSHVSDDERIGELQSVLTALKPYGQKIICGDHNMLSSLDNYDPSLAGRFNEKQRMRFTREGQLDFRAANFLTNSGYQDAAEIIGIREGTVRTGMSTAEGHPDCARLDYFFVSPSLSQKIEILQVLKTSETELASDHYPVLLTLKSWD